MPTAVPLNATIEEVDLTEVEHLIGGRGQAQRIAAMVKNLQPGRAIRLQAGKKFGTGYTTGKVKEAINEAGFNDAHVVTRNLPEGTTVVVYRERGSGYQSAF